MEQLASEAMMNDALQCNNVEVCVFCGAVYSLEMLKPSTEFSDFRFKYCPCCGYTEI